MRRFTVLTTVAFAAAATGCIYEREAVRDDRRVEAPPPAPADTYPPAANPYGRWNWAVGVGWYWIPGAVWAPAWVSWRYGAGYVSWCPLGPAGIAFGYRHPAWVAVSETHFTRPIAAVAIPSQRTYGVV